jgi:hypothetical protein
MNGCHKPHSFVAAITAELIRLDYLYLPSSLQQPHSSTLKRLFYKFRQLGSILEESLGSGSMWKEEDFFTDFPDDLSTLSKEQVEAKIRQYLAVQHVEDFIRTAPRSELIKLKKYLDQALSGEEVEGKP